MDVGANADCKPETLVQFAEMASIFATDLYGIENPKVGLINVGEEEQKGSILAQSAFLIFCFFVCIPLGIGMDWFFSGIGMAVCASGIFFLNKTARHFKMETLGQMAESIAWKLYLGQQKKGVVVSEHMIHEEVKSAMRKV